MSSARVLSGMALYRRSNSARVSRSPFSSGGTRGRLDCAADVGTAVMAHIIPQGETARAAARAVGHPSFGLDSDFGFRASGLLQSPLVHLHPMRLERVHLHELRLLRVLHHVAVTHGLLGPLVRQLVDLLLR